MEINSPAPYIALGSIEKGEVVGEEKTQKQKLCHKGFIILELFFFSLCLVSVIVVTFFYYTPPKIMTQINITVTHEYQKPDWFAEQDMLPEEFESGLIDVEKITHPNKVWGDDVIHIKNRYMKISEIVDKMCDNILPEELTEWERSDPQFWNQMNRDDFDFCYGIIRK